MSGWNHKPAEHVGVLTASVDKGGPMTEPAGINMKTDQVTAIGTEVNDLGSVVTHMQTYSTTNPLTAQQFGTVEGASDAASAFLAAANALAASVGKAATFLTNANTAITTSVHATTAVDEDSAWGVTKAGKGA